MRLIKDIAALGIAFVLALQTVGFSLNTMVAPMFGATQTIICTGNGMLVVLLDANGKPIKTEHASTQDCLFATHSAAPTHHAALELLGIDLLSARSSRPTNDAPDFVASHRQQDPRAPPKI